MIVPGLLLTLGDKFNLINIFHPCMLTSYATSHTADAANALHSNKLLHVYRATKTPCVGIIWDYLVCQITYCISYSTLISQFSPPRSSKHLMRCTCASSFSHCWIMLPMSTSERLQVLKSPPPDGFSPSAFPVRSSKTLCHICFPSNCFMKLLAQALEMLHEISSGISERQSRQLTQRHIMKSTSL